jgi:hypothetical protein
MHAQVLCMGHFCNPSDSRPLNSSTTGNLVTSHAGTARDLPYMRVRGGFSELLELSADSSPDFQCTCHVWRFEAMCFACYSVVTEYTVCKVE